MLEAMNRKFVEVCEPGAIIDNASATTNVIDTMGYDYAVICVYLGATDIALTALKLQEAEAITNGTTLTSGADVTGTVFGTATNTAGSASTLPAATDDAKFYVFYVNLNNGSRMRYLKPTITFGDGTAGGDVAAWAELWRGEAIPYSAATRGIAQELRV